LFEENGRNLLSLRFPQFLHINAQGVCQVEVVRQQETKGIMKIRIIVSYVPRYQKGHRWDFVPPVTGIHLAALTPREHEVQVVHEQVTAVPLDTWPDVVAISFFSGFARRAYEVADSYRKLGVKVIVGGPHASYWTEEALEHADAVVVGEAESVWEQVLHDAKRDSLQPVYQGKARELLNIPTPRYELLEPRFVVRRVMQATRGCPFSCHFCSVPDLNPGFRVRPVEDVIRDIATTSFAHRWQDKVVWFWDDNLLVKRAWAKELLRELRGLNKWWLTQASIDIVKDPELLDLMQQSGCIGIFLGIESLDDDSLKHIGKRQNKVGRYREAVQRLHERGICVMAGFISGFDEQNEASILDTAQGLNDLEFDVPFLSILTPFRGTPLYDQLLEKDRILCEKSWDHYNGYNVAFQPQQMSPNQLLQAHRSLWRKAFSPALVSQRLLRGARQLSPGGMMLSAAMNSFYGLKQITNNPPATASEIPGNIQHYRPTTSNLLTLKPRSSIEQLMPQTAPPSLAVAGK
jgi:radical SAM superfamily enzyme YgiQ (UPF0313 family)